MGEVLLKAKAAALIAGAALFVAACGNSAADTTAAAEEAAAEADLGAEDMSAVDAIEDGDFDAGVEAPEVNVDEDAGGEEADAEAAE